MNVQKTTIRFKLCCLLAGFLGLTYLFVFQIQAVWPFTIDDMYISLRYARHWSEGDGLIWNVGEMPVEGYSNFIFVFFARLALLAGFDPVIALKSFGVLGLLFTSILVYGIARYWLRPSLAILVCVWLLAYQGQIVWSVSGLETSWYQALLCGSIYYLFKGLGYRHGLERPFDPKSLLMPTGTVQIHAYLAAGFLLGLSGLTRPESPAWMLLLISLLCFSQATHSPSKQRLNRAGLFWFVFITMLVYLPYFGWRWHYFGRLFPNPIYCKGISPNHFFNLDKHYLQLIWPFLILSLPAVWQGIKFGDMRHYFLWLPSVMYLILLLNADSVVAFDNRLFLPAYALLLPLALTGLKVGISWWLNDDEGLGWLMYLSVFLITLFFIPMMSLAQYRQFSENPVAGERLRERVADWLEQHTAANDEIVLADSGLIPYLVKRKFIDSYCLNNAKMAQQPQSVMFRAFCHEVMRAEQAVIILTSLTEGDKTIYTPADQCLKEALAKSRLYCLQKRFSTLGAGGCYAYEIFDKHCHG